MEIVTIGSMFLMEHAIEFVNIKKESVKLLQKTNMVRKCKDFMLWHESLGEKVKQLTNCGRVALERRSLVRKRGALTSKKPNKGSKKAWEEFVQWLRTNIFVTVEYFHSDC